MLESNVWILYETLTDILIVLHLLLAAFISKLADNEELEKKPYSVVLTKVLGNIKKRGI